jgi:3-hydroxyisobutyrate dehydrogenase-like beta-hydroxyacid dehydrogenase
METGFIGLGNLGSVMVSNLIERGRQLHLYNRTTEKMKPFEKEAVLHTDIPALTEACDVVLSIVADDKAVQAISFGYKGLIQHLKPGSVHVCLSTIAPATSSQLYLAHKEKGIDYVTATILGRPEAAKARNLIVCFSGTTAKKDEVTELLKDLGGNRIFEFGDDPRSAAVVKVCNNFLIISAIEAMGEAFNLAEKAGADKTAFYQMISETLFNAPIYKNYGKIIVGESYDKAGFTSRLGLKDTKLALSIADEVSTPLPLADLIKNRFYINHNRGRAEHDWTSIVQVIKEEGKT